MPSPLPLQSYDSRILVKENQDTKKKKKVGIIDYIKGSWIITVRVIFHIELLFFVNLHVKTRRSTIPDKIFGKT